MAVYWGSTDSPSVLATANTTDGMLNLPTADGDKSAVPAFSLGSSALLFVYRCVIGADIYDLIPDTARIPTPATQAALGKSGENLASVLHHMASPISATATRTMLDHAAAMIPGLCDVETEEMADGNVTFRVKEAGAQIRMGPKQVSDGTLRLLCFHALLHSVEPDGKVRPGVVCVEEPERGLHPWLIAELVEQFREYAELGQAILTTHSPIVVDAAKPEEVVIVEKVDGTTRARPASDREEVDIFLKRFTLGEFWRQGRFGGVPD